MKIDIEPKTLADQIVAEANRLRPGLSAEHTKKLTDFIIAKLERTEVVEKPKPVVPTPAPSVKPTSKTDDNE